MAERNSTIRERQASEAVALALLGMAEDGCVLGGWSDMGWRTKRLSSIPTFLFNRLLSAIFGSKHGCP
jgi:hypothetical protein